MIIRTKVIAVLVLVAAGSVRGADEPDNGNFWMSEALAEAFEDRTPVAEGPVGAAIDSVSVLAHDALVEGAEAHRERREVALRQAVGEQPVELNVYNDLLRFPGANRNQPVTLPVIVEAVDHVPADTGQINLIRCRSTENPGGLVAVIVPVTSRIPPAGSRTTVTGVFVKLATVSVTAGKPNEIAPLLMAPSLPEVVVASRTELDPALWSEVRHRTPGVRKAEKHLYYQLLRHASQADDAALRASAKENLAHRAQAAPTLARKKPFPVFVDVFKNPKAYESKLVTLKGHARAVRKYPAGANAEGIDTLYEVWLYTDDSQSNPAVVVATSASPELPIGDDVQVAVEATGYFFKIYAYHAHDTTRVAPMILAGRITLLPEPHPAGPPVWLLVILGTAFAALFGWLLLSYLGTQSRRRSSIVDPPDFSAIGRDGKTED